MGERANPLKGKGIRCEGFGLMIGEPGGALTGGGRNGFHS